MINNYFSKEYIGIGTLIELDHGLKGLEQYNNLISKKIVIIQWKFYFKKNRFSIKILHVRNWFLYQFLFFEFSVKILHFLVYYKAR